MAEIRPNLDVTVVRRFAAPAPEHRGARVTVVLFNAALGF